MMARRVRQADASRESNPGSPWRLRSHHASQWITSLPFLNQKSTFSTTKNIMETPWYKRMAGMGPYLTLNIMP